VDDLLWEANVETTEIVAWWTFRQIWKEHCPKIRIRKPCNETCGECTIFRNAFRYRQLHQKVDDSESENSSDDDKSNNEDDTDEAVKDIETIEENIITLTTSFLAGVEHDTEFIIESAHHHVHQSRSMRGLFQLKAQLTIQSLLDLKRHPELDRMVVCDFAQNLTLPHYGGEQPGEIYYLLAYTINLFGIVDLSVTPNKLTCYVYKESTARKGSNNGASLLMHYLFEKNWLMKKNAGKSLAVAMDNCGGQNKNNNVLRLAPHLVEMGYFRSCEFYFYIRGHTKNAVIGSSIR
jgi:hypothetical protein